MLRVEFVTTTNMCLVYCLLVSTFYIASTQAQSGDVDNQLFELLNLNNVVNNRPVGPDRPCRDSRSECQIWSKDGECRNNIDYMAPHCKSSCGYCEKEDDDCTNHSDYCVAWSIRGQCTSNPDYMKVNCQSACNACGENTVPEDFRRYEGMSPGRHGIEIRPPGSSS